MKKYIHFIFCIILSLFILCSCDNTQDAVDDISSPNNDYSESEKAYLEFLFDKDISEITSDDFTKITHLNIIGNHITTGNYDLSTGFDNTGYTYNNKQYKYDLSCGEDLTFLSSFTNLTELGIYFCPSLDDPSFIQEMSQLAKLTLVMTNISELKIPSSLHELNTLYIEASPITNVEIEDHTHLDTVHFINGNLTDISFLSNLSHVRSLTISFNQSTLQNTDVLTSLTDLYYLDIHAPETDFSFLANIGAPVDTLRVGGNSKIPLNLSDSIKENLTTLIVYSSPYIDLTPLIDCPSLKKINTFDVTDVNQGNISSKAELSYRDSKASLNFFSWWQK